MLLSPDKFCYYLKEWTLSRVKSTQVKWRVQKQQIQLNGKKNHKQEISSVNWEGIERLRFISGLNFLRKQPFERLLTTEYK